MADQDFYYNYIYGFVDMVGIIIIVIIIIIIIIKISADRIGRPLQGGCRHRVQSAAVLEHMRVFRLRVGYPPPLNDTPLPPLPSATSAHRLA